MSNYTSKKGLRELIDPKCDEPTLMGMENVYYKLKVEQLQSRIAELEAEVARLKKPSIAEIMRANGKNPDLYGNSGLNNQRFESDISEICPIITEEGQG